MNDFYKSSILKNYLLDICTPEEKRSIEQWLSEDPKHVELLQEKAQDLQKGTPPKIEKKKVKEAVLKEIDKKKPSTSEQVQKTKQNRPYLNNRRLHKRRWLKVAAMIAVILTVVAGGFYFGNQYKSDQKTQTTQSKLTVTQLSYGKTATLHFGEGSIIKLNGGSALRYPKTFAKNKRVVYLKGEAYFSIAHDESRPFIVHTAGKTIRVLGTSFNVEAYEGKKLEVAVSEGRVSVTSFKSINDKKDKRTIVLEKNEWATYKASGKLLKKGSGNIWGEIAWKEGVLVFNNKTFMEAANMLERFYGVKVILKDKSLKNVILKGEHESTSLQDVLESIDFIAGINFSIDDSVVTISNTP